MQPNGITDAPPIAYPTVTIGGRIYVVKFNQFAEYLISLWGYDLKDLLSVISPTGNNPHRFSYTVQLFAACVAHNFTSAMPPQKALTPEEWMGVMPEDDAELWGNIGKAVGLALVKRWSDRAKKVAPIPTTVEATDQKDPQVQ